MNPEIIEKIAELFPDVIRKANATAAVWTDSVEGCTGNIVNDREWDYVVRIIEGKLNEKQWFLYLCHLAFLLRVEYMSTQIKDYMLATPEKKLSAIIKTLKTSHLLFT